MIYALFFVYENKCMNSGSILVGGRGTYGSPYDPLPYIFLKVNIILMAEKFNYL